MHCSNEEEFEVLGYKIIHEIEQIADKKNKINKMIALQESSASEVISEAELERIKEKLIKLKGELKIESIS